MQADELMFHRHRSPVYAAGGMVATSQPAAVLAGVRVLAAGGNAADAAIAAAAALAVTEPTSCGVGGDCFALFYEAASGAITALNGSGRAPAALSLQLLYRQGLGELPPFHAHTVTVPGAVAAWCDLAARHGTMSMRALLAPAMDLAERGFAVAAKTAYFWRAALARQLGPHAGELLIDGRAPAPGEMFRNPGLARVLARIADQGAAGFYQGEIASAMVAAVAGAGGVLSERDLAEHRSTWDQPIATDFAGATIHECPPNGQGLTALLALGILTALGDVVSSPLQGPASSPSPQAITRMHLVIEALRLAFADARRYIADPAFATIPVAELLSPAYVRSRALLIDRTRATVNPAAGSPLRNSDTVYLAVVDSAGNACSFIQSNYMGFGTGITPRGTGFTLQNRGHGFSLDPGHANALAPGKRPYHTIIPGLATDPAGGLHTCFGVMGGFMQPQGHVHVLLAMLIDGLDPQAALDRPRLCIGPDGDVAIEQESEDDRHAAAAAAALAAMGHNTRLVGGHGRALFGRGQIISRDARTGVLCGGSDLRGDGCALGL